MQEYRRPDGSFYKEIVTSATKEELIVKLEKLQAEREANGDRLVAQRMLTKNSKCTCGSGKAIKRCCKYIR